MNLLVHALPVLVAAGIVLNGVRLRQRLRGLATLVPADEPFHGSHRLVTAAGVGLDVAARRAASGYARREGLDVLDLIPEDLPVAAALDFARAVDTTTFRANRLAPGRGATHALLVEQAVLDRAGVARIDGLDPAALSDLTTRLKRYAPASTGQVAVPALHARPDEPSGSGVVAGAGVALVLSAVRYAALAAGVLADPVLGLVAVLAFWLQPYLIFATLRFGTGFGARIALRPRDLHRTVALRPLSEPYRLLRLAAAARRMSRPADPFAAHRPGYAAELVQGVERFLEPRRDTCPWCGSAELSVWVTVADRIQGKPGRFTLERCGACGHVFQNPRLTPAGLDFYYRDFYDGIGEQAVEFVFGSADRPYRTRAELMKPFATPKAWLDIGAGHGHFCTVARDIWPDTVFDGLDMSDSIEEAERRGWVDHGYRGMFPDLAAELTGRYDVLSMHHYLEHTREPLEELDAAAKVLAPGGHLLIELPDPESRLGRLLGGRWLPWFQPQHQHLMPLDNLLRALADRGFTPVATERGPAHQSVDLLAAVALTVNALAPDPRLPWIGAGPTRRRRWGRAALWSAAAPLLVTAFAADKLLDPWIRRTDGGNAYRVLSRRNGG